MRGFYLRDRLSQFVMRACSSQPTKCLCTSTKKTSMKKDTGEEASIRDLDVYRQLDKLDFMTAAKILFTAPPKKKKFGLDFHLVQLFFVCMPSLAVYLVAQYARYEMRRMEAELEVKRKHKEEEDKVKEMEALALEEEKRKSDPELLQVKVRLEALEEAVKGIAVASNKPSSSNLTKDQGRKEKEKPEPGKPKSECKLEDSSTVADERGSSLHSGSPSVDPNQKAASGICPAVEEPTYDKRGEKSKSRPWNWRGAGGKTATLALLLG